MFRLRVDEMQVDMQMRWKGDVSMPLSGYAIISPGGGGWPGGGGGGGGGLQVAAN